jgi:hypothetical protein
MRQLDTSSTNIQGHSILGFVHCSNLKRKLLKILTNIYFHLQQTLPSYELLWHWMAGWQQLRQYGTLYPEWGCLYIFDWRKHETGISLQKDMPPTNRYKNCLKFTRFEIITMATMNGTTLWDVMLCSSVEVHAACQLLLTCFSPALLFDTGDRGNTFLWNVCKLLRNYIVLNPRRQFLA